MADRQHPWTQLVTASEQEWRDYLYPLSLITRQEAARPLSARRPTSRSKVRVERWALEIVRAARGAGSRQQVRESIRFLLSVRDPVPHAQDAVSMLLLSPTPEILWDVRTLCMAAAYEETVLCA